MASIVKFLVLFLLLAQLIENDAHKVDSQTEKQPKTIPAEDVPIGDQKVYNVLVVTLCLRGHINPASGSYNCFRDFTI